MQELLRLPVAGECEEKLGLCTVTSVVFPAVVEKGSVNRMLLGTEVAGFERNYCFVGFPDGCV